MSLTKQLWLAIACITALAFGGSLFISGATSHAYLTEQLALKNMDNAASLALALSQLPKDRTTVELMLSAQFDTGHYQYIQLVSASGDVLVERVNDLPESGAPNWFTKLIPLHAPPGIAQIQDGWHQFGTLKVVSHTQFAYAALWEGLLWMLFSFIAGAAIFGTISTLILNRITQPLHRVVQQAQALGSRRFITTEEPRTLEFRALVRAMNTLSGRMRRMFTEEAARVEELRRKLQHDQVTGLLNRDQFIRNLGTRFLSSESRSSGTIAIIRIRGLAELNRQYGHANVDQLLIEIANRLQQITETVPGSETGRLNGSDMAILVPENLQPDSLLQCLEHELELLHARTPLATPSHLAIASTTFSSTETASKILARLDSALATAEISGEPTILEAEHAAQQPSFATMHDWKHALQSALELGDIRLELFPVINAQGVLLHHEAPLRVKLENHWYNAATVIPWATRAGLAESIDLYVIRVALDTIAQGQGPVAINISSAALSSPTFLPSLSAMLRERRDEREQLWVDVSEYSVVRNLESYRALCKCLRALNCHTGIKHAGRQFSRLGGLHELGLDYVKIDPSFIQGLASNRDNQAIVRGLCTLAHAIGLEVYAQGVTQAADRDALVELGFDGLTGPIIDRT